MRYLALATDYDGTLACDGSVSPETLNALRRVRESGRYLVLVTGRQLEDLQRVFPEYAIFDQIVVENGAVVFCPETREERALGEAPSKALLQRLRALQVTPLAVGRVIVATWSPHETIVLDAIHDLGLELQVIFNKGAVMVLPSGINKASGLRAALTQLSLSPHNVVSVGDAENDHALLSECELGVAVSNALPMLQERSDWVTQGPRSTGVCELIEELLSSDLRALEPRLSRHNLELGKSESGAPVSVHPYGKRILLCGTSGSGKSTLATAFLERLAEHSYQYCLVDPEGDFGNVDNALKLGDDQHPPKADDVIGVLRSAERSVIANLLGVELDKRPEFLTTLLARCTEVRTRTGRPHWFVIDEAHHMLPAGAVAATGPIANAPSGLMLITVHPEKLADRVLRIIDTLIVVGTDPEASLAAFARAIDRPVPVLANDAPLEPGEALIWSWRTQRDPQRFRSTPPKTEHRRHRRKYASGALGEDKSFYFRGPHKALNLRAHNLMLFLQIGDGVDDETWLHHLKHHDYSEWIKSAIKNDSLASDIAAIEHVDAKNAEQSRQHIREAIEKVYTLPA